MKRGLFGPVFKELTKKYDNKSGNTNKKWPYIG